MKHVLITLIAIACLSLTGCNPEETLRQAEIIAAETAQQLEVAEARIEQLEALAKTAADIAESTGSETAIQAAEIAQQSLAEAKAIVPSLKLAAQTAQTAAEQAASQVAAGDSVWAIIATAAGIVVPSISGAVMQWRKARKSASALKVTARHADRMENIAIKAGATDDVQKVLERAAKEQVDAKLQELIQKARGKI